jgi:hypothetical protein
MKRFPGGVMVYMWVLSKAVTAMENAKPEILTDMKSAAGRNNFRSEVRNIEYLFKRLIRAHDAAEPDETLHIGRLGRDEER